MWSFSEEIQMRTHSKTTRCQIQGTEVDALCDLVASASFSPKPFAFTFLGEEPLALAISSWAIPEGIEILQKGVTQSKQEFLFLTPRGGDVLAPIAVDLSASKRPTPPSSKPNPCSS